MKRNVRKSRKNQIRKRWLAGTFSLMLVGFMLLSMAQPAFVNANAKTEADRYADSFVERAEAIELQGEAAADVLALAQSQLGYEESTIDFVTHSVTDENGDEGTIQKGMTIYGVHAGDRYGDWNGAFAQYVLEKAQIEMIPGFSTADELAVAVRDEEEDETLSALWLDGDVVPAAGDLVLFKDAEAIADAETALADAKADLAEAEEEYAADAEAAVTEAEAALEEAKLLAGRIGIVSEVAEADEVDEAGEIIDPAHITVIEGDVEGGYGVDVVKENTYELFAEETEFLGYIDMQSVESAYVPAEEEEVIEEATSVSSEETEEATEEEVVEEEAVEAESEAEAESEVAEETSEETEATSEETVAESEAVEATSEETDAESEAVEATSQAEETKAVSEPTDAAREEAGETVKEAATALTDLFAKAKAAMEAADLTGMRLIVGTSDASILANEKAVVAVHDDVYLLQFESIEATKEAYLNYYNKVDFIAADVAVSVAEGEKDEDPAEEIITTDNVYTEEANPFTELETALEEEVAAPAKKVRRIALIDTGAALSDNVIDAVSMIGEDGSDDNGHGERMVKFITEQDPDAEIISIKALGKDGKGDISAVIAGMTYAMENGASIINLSLAAYASAENAALADAVRKATEAGITVIGAAGNQGFNAKYYIPGNIAEAIIVGSADENGEKIDASNFGETVDYNVVSKTTSEAAAKLTGFVSANGAEAIDGALGKGLIFATDYAGEDKSGEEYEGAVAQAIPEGGTVDREKIDSWEKLAKAVEEVKATDGQVTLTLTNNLVAETIANEVPNGTITIDGNKNVKIIAAAEKKIYRNEEGNDTNFPMFKVENGATLTIGNNITLTGKQASFSTTTTTTTVVDGTRLQIKKGNEILYVQTGTNQLAFSTKPTTESTYIKNSDQWELVKIGNTNTYNLKNVGNNQYIYGERSQEMYGKSWVWYNGVNTKPMHRMVKLDPSTKATFTVENGALYYLDGTNKESLGVSGTGAVFAVYPPNGVTSVGYASTSITIITTNTSEAESQLLYSTAGGDGTETKTFTGANGAGFFVTVNGGAFNIEGNAKLCDFKTVGDIENAPRNVAPVVVDGGNFEMRGGSIEKNSVGYVANEKYDGMQAQGARPVYDNINGTEGYLKSTEMTNTAGGIIFRNGANGSIIGQGAVRENSGDAGGIIATGEGTVVAMGGKTTVSKTNGQYSYTDTASTWANGGIIEKNIGFHHAGGAQVERGARFVMLHSKSTINDNLTWAKGGAVWVTKFGSRGYAKVDYSKKYLTNPGDAGKDGIFVMKDGVIDGNTAFLRGGGINIESNSVSLQKGTISNNNSRVLGGGIYVEGDFPDYTFTLRLDDAYIGRNAAVDYRLINDQKPSVGGPLDSYTNERLNEILDREITRTGSDYYPVQDNRVVNENSIIAGGPKSYNNSYNWGNRTADPKAFWSPHAGNGGGVWLCPIGGTASFAIGENVNVIIDDNYVSTKNRRNSGEDFYLQPGTGHLLISTLKSGENWINEDTSQALNTLGSPLYSGPLALRNESTYGEGAKSGASVQIVDNLSRDGGGIAADGTLLFGLPEDIWYHTAEMQVNKSWHSLLEKKEIAFRVGYQNGTSMSWLDFEDYGFSMDGVPSDTAAYDMNPEIEAWKSKITIPTSVQIGGQSVPTYKLKDPDTGVIYDPSKIKAAAGDTTMGITELGQLLKNSNQKTKVMDVVDWKLVIEELEVTKVTENGETTVTRTPMERYVSAPTTMTLKLDANTYTLVDAGGRGDTIAPYTIGFTIGAFEGNISNDLEEQTVEKYINNIVHEDLAAYEEEFEYEIMAYVPAEATEVTISDTLVDALMFVDNDGHAQFIAGANGTDAVNSAYKANAFGQFEVYDTNDHVGDGTGTVGIIGALAKGDGHYKIADKITITKVITNGTYYLAKATDTSATTPVSRYYQYVIKPDGLATEENGRLGTWYEVRTGTNFYDLSGTVVHERSGSDLDFINQWFSVTQGLLDDTTTDDSYSAVYPVLNNVAVSTSNNTISATINESNGIDAVRGKWITLRFNAAILPSKRDITELKKTANGWRTNTDNKQGTPAHDAGALLAAELYNRGTGVTLEKVTTNGNYYMAKDSAGSYYQYVKNPDNGTNTSRVGKWYRLELNNGGTKYYTLDGNEAGRDITGIGINNTKSWVDRPTLDEPVNSGNQFGVFSLVSDNYNFPVINALEPHAGTSNQAKYQVKFQNNKVVDYKTNIVTVNVNQPEKYVNNKVHQNLDNFAEPFEYSIMAYVPEGASELVIWDTLREDLMFVDADGNTQYQTQVIGKDSAATTATADIANSAFNRKNGQDQNVINNSMNTSGGYQLVWVAENNHRGDGTGSVTAHNKSSAPSAAQHINAPITRSGSIKIGTVDSSKNVHSDEYITASNTGNTIWVKLDASDIETYKLEGKWVILSFRAQIRPSRYDEVQNGVLKGGFSESKTDAYDYNAQTNADPTPAMQTSIKEIVDSLEGQIGGTVERIWKKASNDSIYYLAKESGSNNVYAYIREKRAVNSNDDSIKEDAVGKWYQAEHSSNGLTLTEIGSSTPKYTGITWITSGSDGTDLRRIRNNNIGNSWENISKTDAKVIPLYSVNDGSWERVTSDGSVTDGKDVEGDKSHTGLANTANYYVNRHGKSVQTETNTVTVIPELIDLPVTKKWAVPSTQTLPTEDEFKQHLHLWWEYGSEKGEVTELYKDQLKVTVSETFNGGYTWTINWENLPELPGGHRYYIEEDKFDNYYNPRYTNTDSDNHSHAHSGGTITNTPQSSEPKTSVEAKKIWDIGDAAQKTSITATLKRKIGKETPDAQAETVGTQTLDASNNWYYEWSDLNQYKEDNSYSPSDDAFFEPEHSHWAQGTHLKISGVYYQVLPVGIKRHENKTYRLEDGQYIEDNTNGTYVKAKVDGDNKSDNPDSVFADEYFPLPQGVEGTGSWSWYTRKDSYIYFVEYTDPTGFKWKKEIIRNADGSKSSTLTNTKPQIEKYVNKDVHDDIFVDDHFRYDLMAYVPTQATQLEISDQLIDSLNLVSFLGVSDAAPYHLDAKKFVNTQSGATVDAANGDVELKNGTNTPIKLAVFESNNHEVNGTVASTSVQQVVEGTLNYDVDKKSFTINIGDGTNKLAIGGKYVMVSFMTKIVEGKKKDVLAISNGTKTSDSDKSDVKWDTINPTSNVKNYGVPSTADQEGGEENTIGIGDGVIQKVEKTPHSGLVNTASYRVNYGSNEWSSSYKSNTVTVRPFGGNIRFGKVDTGNNKIYIRDNNMRAQFVLISYNSSADSKNNPPVSVSDGTVTYKDGTTRNNVIKYVTMPYYENNLNEYHYSFVEADPATGTAVNGKYAHATGNGISYTDATNSFLMGGDYWLLETTAPKGYQAGPASVLRVGYKTEGNDSGKVYVTFPYGSAVNAGLAGAVVNAGNDGEQVTTTQELFQSETTPVGEKLPYPTFNVQNKEIGVPLDLRKVDEQNNPIRNVESFEVISIPEGYELNDKNIAGIWRQTAEGWQKIENPTYKVVDGVTTLDTYTDVEGEFIDKLSTNIKYITVATHYVEYASREAEFYLVSGSDPRFTAEKYEVWGQNGGSNKWIRVTAETATAELPVGDYYITGTGDGQVHMETVDNEQVLSTPFIFIGGQEDISRHNGSYWSRAGYYYPINSGARAKAWAEQRTGESETQYHERLNSGGSHVYKTLVETSEDGAQAIYSFYKVGTDKNSADTEKKNIISGNYWLYEKSAPAGYFLSGEPVQLKIEPDPSDPSRAKLTHINNGDSFEEDAFNEYIGLGRLKKGGTGEQTYDFSFMNQSVYELPSSGGIGTYWNTIIGTMFICMAGAFLLRAYANKIPVKADRNKKRMNMR